MQNQMTICPPITANNNSKQYDSAKSPLAMLEQQCLRIGGDNNTSNKSSTQSIDHTKKDNGSHSLNKIHLNGYKPSNLAINQLANLANNYDGGRRSGNSASISPDSIIDKRSSYQTNLTANGSRPNSNNGNSRPNSNNSGNSSLASSKGKEQSKLSFKPYEEQTNVEKRKRHSPELEQLRSLNKNDRKSSDSSTNGISPKNSVNCLPQFKTNTTTTPSNISYAAQQQQLLESRYFELQYQQYMAALGYSFSNPSLMAAAAALTGSPLGLPNAASSSINSRNSNTSSNPQPAQQTQTPNLPPSAHQAILAQQSTSQCPPGCNSCIIHNPLFSSFASAASTQAPSSVQSSNNSNNAFSAQHLAALSSQYPHIPPHFLPHLYGLTGYNSLGGLTPPVSSASTNNIHNNSSSHSQSVHQQPNSHSTNSNHNQLSMHHSSSTTNSSNHHNNNNSNASNKSTSQACTFINMNGTFCGKRFNNSDDYLMHLKSHTVNEFTNLNPTSLESLYGSYEAMLSNPAALANLRRSAMHDSVSSSRFHPYNKPSSTATNTYSQSSQNSANSASLSAMLPPSLSSLANPSSSGIPPFVPTALGALGSLNGLGNLNNNPALAAAFNMYSQYNGRVGPTA